MGSLPVCILVLPVACLVRDPTARWNASLSFANFLDQNIPFYRGLNVLELGAGGGLPGIVTAKNGAKKVTSSDKGQQVQTNNPLPLRSF